MDRIAALCRYVVVLLVFFEHVRCANDGWGLWKYLNDTEKSWGVTVQLQSSGYDYKEPPLIMKLKKLSCAGLNMNYKNAYVIYEVDKRGNPSFELVAVRSEGGKIATSVVKLPTENLLVKKNKKEVVLKDINAPFPYDLTFNESNEAQEVFNKYSERTAPGCSPP